MEKRLVWVDNVRGIAFLMVIYSHLTFSNDFLMKFFLPIYLTTFFFVSGYLFDREKSFLSIFEQRTRTLLIPLFLLGCLLILMNQIFSFNESVSLTNRIKGLFFQTGNNVLLWFIASLYIISITYWLILKFRLNDIMLLVISFLFFVISNAYVNWFNYIPLPWNIQILGFGYFYMSLGILYKKHEDKIDKFFDSKVTLSLLFIIYISYILIFRSFTFSGSPLIFDAILITTIGIILCVKIAKIVKINIPIISFIGANSLLYFALHGKVYSLLEHFFSYIIVKLDLQRFDAINFLSGIFITILCALILIYPIKLINRYAPFAVGKGYKLY